MKSNALLAAGVGAVLSVTTAGPAAAIDPGAGVRGTLTMSWGNITGSPITSWNGATTLTFDPSATARRATITGARSSVGEARRALYAPQTQAARVTSLTSAKAVRVLCQRATPGGGLVDSWATATSTVRAITDSLVAFEILRPVVNLRKGTGRLHLGLYVHADPNGWYIRDVFVLPGRYTAAGSYPCPGSGGPPSGSARIFGPNGGGAVPVVLSDWLGMFGDTEWPLRRTSKGWRVVISRHVRETFSESRFGPQDSQRIDVDVTSSLHLAGSLKALGARCTVPTEAIRKARSKKKALRLARKAGLTKTRFAGTRRTGLPYGRPYFQIKGGGIGNGTAPCGVGKPKLVKWVPSS